jgi:hypothetical protein
MRVAEPGANGEDPPALDPAHDGRLAQALHHRVVVHGDVHLFAADLRQGRGDQVEILALPVACQVLRPALDRAVGPDDSRARDAEERRQAERPMRG